MSVTEATCMPCPEGQMPAATCPDCGAVATYLTPGEPATNRVTPPDSCACRCHESWRFISKKQAS